MSKMKEIVMDIEEYVTQGFDAAWIAQRLQVPIDLVLNVEEDVMQLGNPYFYGPDPE
jgi:hypothetical protein